MERRDFMANSGMALVASLLAQVPSAYPTNPPAELAGNLQLSRRLDPEKVKSVYEGSRTLEGSEIPYVYAFYDEQARKFLNPLRITPLQKAGSYTLEPMLHAFNLRKSDQANFKRLKNQVQLGFNATAPITKSDQLTWLFMSAIDVFFGKATDRPDQLTKFTKDNTGVPLQANPKVSVTNGIVSLQITAFGQKQDGFWRKFFDAVAAVVKSPVVGNTLKGFGIPSLAGDALTFVDHAVDVFAEKEKLVALWQTGSLEFAVHEGANARFKMNPGLWVTVDANYAQETNFLEGHTVDLDYQSYRLKDKNGSPADANYLVADIKFNNQKSN